MVKIILICCLFFVNFSNCFAQNNLEKKYNLQTNTTFSSTKGSAFGDSTRRQILNNSSELPISKLSSIGEIAQFSHVNSSHNNNSQRYSLNSFELFHRYRFLDTKYANFIIHNSYKFQGIYNENKYLSLMPKQNDYELRLLIAHNMTDRLINNILHSEKPYFARFEIAYRYRFNNPFDEIRQRFYLGIKLNQKFTFLLQHDINWAVTTHETSTRNSPRQMQNFQFSKNFHNIIAPSLIYKINKDNALQFAYFKRLGGNDLQYDSAGFTLGIMNSF
jgi:hypothetical protein